MTASRVVTVVELHRLRFVLDDLNAAVRSMGAAGLDNIAIVETRNQLRDEIVAVETPCLLCKGTFHHEAIVGDPERAVPRAVICGTCDDKAMSTTEGIK